MTYEIGGDIVERYGVVGEYATNTGLEAARDLLQTAWENGAEEFTVPQDIFEASDFEKFEYLCDKHNLTLVTIKELGYQEGDVATNLRIWRTTDEFERRGILVADENGEYATSLKKMASPARR